MVARDLSSPTWPPRWIRNNLCMWPPADYYGDMIAWFNGRGNVPIGSDGQEMTRWRGPIRNLSFGSKIPIKRRDRTNGRERVVCWLLNLRMDRAANWLLVELSSYNCWNLLLPPAQNYCCSVGEFGFGVATRCCFGCIYSASLLLRQQTYAPYYIGCLVVSEIQRDWTGV